MLRWGGVVLAGALVLAATLPWWLGGALALVTPFKGFSFQSYERISYTRFALHGVEFNRSGVQVRLDRAEADTPLLWLWRHATNDSTRVVGGRWEVTVAANTTPPPKAESDPGGWLRLRSLLGRIATGLARWLPQADVGAGRVTWPGGGLTLGAAAWQDRTLKIQRLEGAGFKTDATLSFPASADLLRLEARDADAALTATLESRTNQVTGEIRWHDQPVALTAGFADRGWIPASGELVAQAWRLPAAAAKLGEYYDTLQLGGRIDWKESRLTAELAADGTPIANGTAPPLDVRLRGNGDLTAFRVEVFNVQIPGVTARLDAPVVIGRDGRFSGENAQFVLTADLARLPWVQATGKVDGSLKLVSSGVEKPVIDYALSAADVQAGEWQLARANANGRLDWPRLQVARAELVPVAGDRIEASGGWDFSSKEIVNGVVSGDLQRSTLSRWVPAAVEFERIAFSGRIAGPLASVRHSGTATARAVALPNLQPLGMTAEWSGVGAEVETLAAKAAAGSTTVTASGAVSASRLRLDRFELNQGGVPRLQLSNPAEIRWSPVLATAGIQLRSGDGGGLALRFAGGPTGEIELRANRFFSSWLQELLVLPGPAWDLGELAVTAKWDRGPVEGSVVLGGNVALSETQSMAIAASAHSEKGGWRIDRLNASEQGAAVVDASGRIGLTLRVDEAPFVRLEDAAPLEIALTAAPNASFWAQIRTLTGLELQEPQASAKLTGTWSKPEGELRMRATRVAFEGGKFSRPLPLVENLDVEAVGDAGGIMLRRLALLVEGQAVSATGRLVVPGGGWPELGREPLAALRRGGEAEINLPEADLARLARLAPEYLAPQGRLGARLRILPGGNLDGWLEVTDAASRPLGPLGAFREVNFRVNLSEGAVRLETARAQLGGQPVTLQGTIGLPAEGPVRYDLALKAENVPLARQTGLLLRGDLDLQLRSPAGAVPRISGTVILRDSLFLSDLRSLLASGPRGSSRPPPYFAVETPGLRDWQLAVAIRGDRFLRLRTALFNGVASANFQLAGTLGAPWATGEATVAEGRLMLPFATFSVERGRAFLSAANPYEPQLEVSGTSRSHGFDLRLEATGPAADPALQFSSAPPLSSEQILLLVMAGEFPQPENGTAGRLGYASLGTFLGQSLLNNVSGGRVDPDKLTLVAGGDVSRSGRETYAVEYELSKRLSLLGEYDEFDNFNAGLRWRLFSKGGKESDAGK